MTTFEFTRAWLVARLRITGDRGATLIEYALLVLLLAVVCVAAVTLLSRTTPERFSPDPTGTTVP